MKPIIAISLAPLLLGGVATAQSPLAGLWEFDDSADLGKATVGTDLTVNGTAPSWVTSQTYGSTTLDGVITTVQGTPNGFTATHGIGVNGGGTTKANEYTFIFDVSRPDSTAWRSFWQSDLTNANDAEFFVRSGANTLGRAGTGHPGYTSGTLAADTWQRLVVSIDNGNFFRVYLDGALMAGGARTAPSIDDASYGLDPSQVLLFRDDNGENHSLVIGMAGIYGTALNDAQVSLLSTAGTAVHRFNPLVWTGADSSEWSTNVIGGSKNWNLGAGAEDFRFADTTTFNDSATGTTVDISNGDVTPSGLVFDNTTKNFTITGSNGIAGATTLVKDGSGSLTLGTANSFTGASTLNAGSVTLANSAALQNSAVTVGASASIGFNGITSATVASLAGAGSVSLQNDSSAAVALSTGGNNASTTFSGALSGAGSLIKNGTGTLTLSGDNSHTGGITLANGAITIADGNGLGTGALTVTKNATGTFLSLSNNGNVVVGNDIVLPGTAQRYDFVKTAGGSTDFSGTISGGGAGMVLRMTTDAGGDNTTVHRLSGSNSFSGTLQIWRGVVEIANPDAAGSALVLHNGNNSAAGDLRFSASMTFANNIRLAEPNMGIGVANPDHSVILTGTIDQSGSNRPLRKEGDGTLVIAGNATYTGTTSVNAGTLLINGALNSTATTTVAGGATLGGTGSIAGAVNVTGVLSPGASIESLSTGALTMNVGSTFVFEAADNGTTGADLLVANGALSLTDVTLDLSAANLELGTWSLGDKLTLISYLGSPVTSGFDGFDDGTAYAFGANQWLFNYADTTAGSNFNSEANGELFVTMTLIPEPTTTLLAAFGTLVLLRRRRPAPVA